MATYTRQPFLEQGQVLTANAATVTVGDNADNQDGKLGWVIRNGSGSPITVLATIVNAPTLNDASRGLLTKNISALSVAAGAMALMGPFPTSVYNDGNNRVTIICSAVASVTVSPVTLP